MSEQVSLYQRLGGYDGIATTTDALLRRLRADPQLARFWAHRSDDGIRREQQLLVNFLCDRAGGPMHYVGRDMVTSHKGMKISESDWSIFLQHLRATLETLGVPSREAGDVLGFVESVKAEIVELP